MRRTSGSGIILFILIGATSILAQTDISVLASSIRIGTSEQKRDALFSIKNLHSEPASRAAIPALTDADDIVRATAASAIISLPGEEAVRVLTPLLSDKSVFVRREAALALGSAGDWRATETLERSALKDGDAEVRTAAVIGLGKLGDPNSMNTLIGILKRKPADSDEMLRRSAARAIGQAFHLITFGNTAVVTPQNFLPEKYKVLGDAAALRGSNVKHDFGPAKAVLINVLNGKNEEDDTRREAAFALGESRDPAVASVLRSYLRSSDPYLAEICKESLLKIETPPGPRSTIGN
ncbi:MAG: HEAT repeat domain-containing protein [Pyrinomonadaceae bacterium]